MQFGLIGAGSIGKMRAQALNFGLGCRPSAVTTMDEGSAWVPTSTTGVRSSGKSCESLKIDLLEAVVNSTPPQSHEKWQSANLCSELKQSFLGRCS